MNLADRLGRGSLHLRKLFIGNVRETRQETREALALMVKTILSSENSPTQLGLFNLGFEAHEGEAIFDLIVQKRFGGLSELRLDQNPEFWTSESGCLELLLRLLSNQT